MCDYSMYSVASRPARAGDKLVTGSFPTTTTRGFAAVDEPGVGCSTTGCCINIHSGTARRKAYSRTC